MKKKSFSLQKLPELAKIKKEKIVEKNEIFQSRLKELERIQYQNEMMNKKLRPYQTSRTFKIDSQLKIQQKTHKLKITNLLGKFEKYTQLEPIIQSQFRSTKKIISSEMVFKTPMKKMNVEIFVKEKKEKQIQEDIKKVQIENNRRQYLPSVIQSEKKTLPYYSQDTKRYAQEPFVKLEQKDQMIKIRFLNGFQKWVKKANLKSLQENQKLTLDIYRKNTYNIEPPESIQKILQLPHNKEIIEKINIDSIFLNKMLNQVYHKKNPRPQIRQLLREELYGNYEDSVKEFNKIFVQKRQIKKINRFQRKNNVSHEIKDYIDHNLICSYNLQFLSIYMLNKSHYIALLVQSYDIINKLQRFRHFTKFYTLNNTSKFVLKQDLIKQISKFLSQQKDKIENIIYEIEEHLNLLTKYLVKDIQHIIFLNPRLVGTNYQEFIKIFISSFSQHLSKIIKSVVIYTINLQLEQLTLFYSSYSKNSSKELWTKQVPMTNFYGKIGHLNTPIFSEEIKETIIHGPGILPIILTLKKWKRIKYTNIFRFIIQSRKKIRTFTCQNWKAFKNENQDRILFDEPKDLIQKIVIEPLRQYISNINESESVNGCIYNKKLAVFQYVNVEKFKKDVLQSFTKEKQQKLRMYTTYFELWQLYYSEKPYIDQFIYLFKKLKIIKLLEQELTYLKLDLQIIKSIPNIIQIQYMRLDVHQIKLKIQTTIEGFIKKILKVSEEVLVKMLEQGYEQTIRTKSLNKVNPYNNLAEYIQFVNYLNNRQIQKSINKIAENVLFIDLNWEFLLNNHYDVKGTILKRYLESGTWIKTIRKTALENKQKLQVDPFTFLKGVKEKKGKIYLKYNKILKEIIELMKVNDLKSAIKLSVLSKNIHQEMTEITSSASQIIKEQLLLELLYAPEDPSLFDINVVYRSDLTFFFKQQKFLKKYLQFWQYVSKLKSVIQRINDRNVMIVDGIQFIRLLREGQQLISNIKISTLNKRFLILCDQVNKQIDPFLKCSKLFLFLICGSQMYRQKVLKEVISISILQKLKKDVSNLTIKQLMSFQWQLFDWLNIYAIKERQQLYEDCAMKLNNFTNIIKNLQITTSSLRGAGSMKEYDILVISDSILQVLMKCEETLGIIQANYGHIFKSKEFDEEILVQTSKKFLIFSRSLQKIKPLQKILKKYYCLFQLIFPLVQRVFQQSNFNQYHLLYENLISDFNKKTDLVKKLSFFTFYEDKVRLNYDEQIKKLEEFQIRFQNQILSTLISSYKCFDESSIDMQNLFNCLSSINESSNPYLCQLLGDWCTSATVKLQYNHNAYEIILSDITTIYYEKIKVNLRFKLFVINKTIHYDQELFSIKCGLFDIVQHIKDNLPKKIEEQTSTILRVIYEFHYNTKQIFSFYLFSNTLLMQSILNALYIMFFIDLSLVYEHKYDLNILLTTISQSIFYAPKEPENIIYAQTIMKVLTQFLSILDVLQEKQYGLDDAENGKLKKLYAYNAIPKLQIVGFKENYKIQWLQNLKQQKQDDFILNTHLNPAFSALHFPQIDGSRIQGKEIEKKQQIIGLFQKQNDLQSLIIAQKRRSYMNDQKKLNKLKIVCNIAPHLQIKDIDSSFSFEMIHQNLSENYTYQAYQATELLLEASHLQKIFITNIHPNHKILGVNFFKSTEFLENSTKNMLIVVNTDKQLLINAQIILKNQRNKQASFIYIYYDKLDYNRIQTQIIQDHCIVYQKEKLQFNTLLKKQLNFNEKQIFQNLMTKEMQFKMCYPLMENKEKMIPMNMLKFNIDNKEKQIISGFIYNFEKEQGFYPQVTEQKLAIIGQPIYILTKSHFIMNHYYDMAQYIYTHVLKTSTKDKVKDALYQVINVVLQVNNISMYTFPIEQFTKAELFTHFQFLQYETRVQDKYKKDIIHVKKYKKPYICVGLLEQIIQFARKTYQVNKTMESFRIKGNQDSPIKWILIDLLEESEICEYVFQFFMQSYATKEFVFFNGNSISTAFHFTQRSLKEHSHKLIFLVNPKYLQRYVKDFPPVLIINESLKFDPIKEFKLVLAHITHQFPTEFVQLIDMSRLIESYKKIVDMIALEKIGISVLEVMKNILFIMFNEIRKRQISYGHYQEKTISLDESKSNYFGSIDLRQKVRLTHEQLVELQQIQKKMDTNRRQIYKMFTQNIKPDESLTESIQQKLQNQFNILNPPLFNKAAINELLNNSLIFAFYYSFVLNHHQMKEELSTLFESLTHVKQLYRYCFSIQLCKWQRWQQIDTQLTLQSCSSDVSSKVLHTKELLRHNLQKFRLQQLRNYSLDLQSIHSYQPQMICLKGYQIYFAKMFMIYKMKTKITISRQEYPKWAFLYELQVFLSRNQKIKEPFRLMPQIQNKKIAKLLHSFSWNSNYINFSIIKQSSQLKQWLPALKYNLFRKGKHWHRIINTSLLFINTLEEKDSHIDNQWQLSNQIYVSYTPQANNPYKILAMTHHISRFNDLQSNLDHIILSLKTYVNKILYLQAQRYNFFSSKGLVTEEIQNIFGIKIILDKRQMFFQARKKIKEVVLKIRNIQLDDKSQLTQQELQKLVNFDRIQEIDTYLGKLVDSVKIQHRQISKDYAIRYMLKKPRKYEKIVKIQAVNTKKRLKSPPKIQFDDILIYDSNYDKTNLLSQQLNQVILFLHLQEKVLLIQHDGSYEEKTIQKYIKGYKIYQKAIKTMTNNKNTKPFSVDLLNGQNLELNIKQIKIFNIQSINRIKEELLQQINEKLLIIYIFNKKIIKYFLEFINQKIILNDKIKIHLFIFCPRLNSDSHFGFRYIIQENIGHPDYNYLSGIKRQKELKLKDKLQEHFKKIAKQRIQACKIGTEYIAAAIQKFTDIKNYTLFVQNELSNKKATHDQIKSQLQDNQNRLNQCKRSIIENQDSIKQLETQLIFLKYKKNFYTGQKQFYKVYKQIREINRKKLEKEINRPEYIDDNSYNISYVYIFNILADNNYFPDKTLNLLDQEYHLNKNYQINDEQKKQFQKLINFGRLSALIQNQQLIFQDKLINEDHLIMADRVRHKFPYLRHVHDTIVQEKVYDSQHLFSLQIILSQELKYVSQKKNSEIVQIFNKYIAYLFTHKYISLILNKGIQQKQLKLKKAKESIIKSRQKIQHLQLSISSNATYLQQINSKYQVNRRQLQTCLANQLLFIQQTQSNISLISNLYCFRLSGLNILYRYYFIRKYEKESIKKVKVKVNKSNQEEQGKVQQAIVIFAQVVNIKQNTVIEELSRYILQDLPSKDHKKLSQQVQQFILFNVKLQTINILIDRFKIQTLKELYDRCIIYLLETLLPDDYELFDADIEESLLLQRLDQQKYTIMNVQYKDQRHYLCKQIQNSYRDDVRLLLNKINNQEIIIDQHISKFTEKITFIQSKSSQSIKKYQLSQENINVIQESINNALKTLTGQIDFKMYYEGQWSTKNQDKLELYQHIVDESKEQLKALSNNALVRKVEITYYLKLLGMICKKIGIQNRQLLIDQLFYDHSINKNDFIKQISQKILQKKILNDQNNETSTQSKSLSLKNMISTLNMVLSTPLSLIMIHGNHHLHKHLQMKCMKMHTILKTKDSIQYYIEQNKSKEYWILMNVSYNMKIKEIAESYHQLKRQIEANNENHMKFIMFFEGNAWSNRQLSLLSELSQPIYRFYYQNSPSSIYFHTYEMLKEYSNLSYHHQMRTIKAILQYYFSYVPHTPVYHFSTKNLAREPVMQIIQNSIMLYNVHEQTVYFKLFRDLFLQWNQIKQAFSMHVSSQSNQYMPLWSTETSYNQLKYQEGHILQQHFLVKWLSQMKCDFTSQKPSAEDIIKKLSLAQIMKPKRDQAGFKIEGIEQTLSNPYKFIIINKCFSKLLQKIANNRTKIKKQVIVQVIDKTVHQKISVNNQIFQITNENELLLQIYNGSHEYGVRLNKISIELTKKQVSGGINIFMDVIGYQDQWLQNIFKTDLFMTISDKKHKNTNELNFIKGILFKFSQPFIFVKKEVTGNEFNEQQANILRQLPQYKKNLPVYTSNNIFIGIIQLTTNEQIKGSSQLVIRLKN